MSGRWKTLCSYFIYYWLNIHIHLFTLTTIHIKQHAQMSTLEFQQHLVSLRQQLYYFALSLTKDRDDAQDLLHVWAVLIQY